MAKAKSKSKHWEREAKAGAEKITGVEKDKDDAKKEAQVTRLATVEDGAPSQGQRMTWLGSKKV